MKVILHYITVFLMTMSTRCSKISLCLLNIVLFLSGFGLFHVTLEAKSEFDVVFKMSPEDFRGQRLVTSLTMVTGLLMLPLSILGLTSACHKKKCFLVVYFLSLLIFCVLYISVTIFAYVKASDRFGAWDTVRRAMDKAFSEKPVSSVVHYLQSERQCCGTTGPNYWNGSIPDSCRLREDTPFKAGCLETVLDLLKEYSFYVANCLLLPALLLVGCGFCSISLFKTEYQLLRKN